MDYLEKRMLMPGLLLAVGFFVVGEVREIYHEKTHHCIPKNQQVERECMSPAKIRFEFLDLDGNNTNEFLLNYKGARYLFKTNELGEPCFQRYDLVPRSR